MADNPHTGLVTAHELAQLAVQIAMEVAPRGIAAFHAKSTAASNIHRVTVELVDGSVKQYTVVEEAGEG